MIMAATPNSRRWKGKIVDTDEFSESSSAEIGLKRIYVELVSPSRRVAGTHPAGTPPGAPSAWISPPQGANAI